MLPVWACIASNPEAITLASLSGWASSAGSSAQLVASVVAAVVALIGIPVAYLQIKKTRAEIRKLELEAAAIEQKRVPTESFLGGHQVVLDNVHDSRVDIQILADPRFVGPLLVLLDFIVVWVILTLANYGFAAFLDKLIAQLILAAIAAILLIPILRNALRIRRTLRSAYPGEPQTQKTASRGNPSPDTA